MIATLIGLELRLLDTWSREQLIAELLVRRDRLSLEFTREWLEEQSVDRLRILVLAAKLLYLLRRKKSSAPEPEFKRRSGETA